MRSMTFAAIGLIGTWLFGNGAPVKGFTNCFDTLERSPCRYASGGTICDRVVSNGRRTPSYVAKKNVRLCTIGPPTVTPPVFALIDGLMAFPLASRGANWSTLENRLF